ncbi:polysaccharide pyruvyl transferase family protein [Vibrio cyclitrophicus]
MKGKKIGILTIHSVYNYGAMLQAYALDQYVKSIGFDSEIIDYQPYHLCKDYQFFKRDLILRPYIALAKIKNMLINGKISKKFDDFYYNEMSISSISYGTCQKLGNSEYDILITGSDQIWNPHIVNSDDAYLLSFARNEQIKYAYSSSFGVSDISDDWTKKVNDNLNKFEKIGVREDSGLNILINSNVTVPTETVLDPVFLFDSNYWEELSCNDLNPIDKYLLVYSLEVNQEMRLNAESIAKEKGLKIVTIHPFNDNYDFADICINEAGPKEFLSLIRNAEYVVTNSFHGTVFSLIFDRPLNCILHSKTGTRMASIFSRFSLKPKSVSFSEREISIYEHNDSSRVLMESIVLKCKNFLKL